MDPQIDSSIFLEFFSHRIMEIAIPVILTLFADAFLTRFLEQNHEKIELDRSFYRTMNPSGSGSNGISFTWSIILAFILVGMIIIVTAILLLCYYYGCIKAIMIWMIIAVSLLLSLYIYLAFSSVPELLNTPFDWIGGVLLIFNLVVVGNLSIFWRAPSIVTHAFLILISILIAVIFLNLPDWTVWILLVILIIYDCCVVLCPHGLLNVIIKKSEERGDAIPALVYASAAWFTDIDHNEEDEDNCENDEAEFDEELNDENELNAENELNDENKGESSSDESDHRHHHNRNHRRAQNEKEVQDDNQPDRNRRQRKNTKKAKEMDPILLQPNQNDANLDDGRIATVDTIVVDDLSTYSEDEQEKKKRKKKKKKNSQKLTDEEIKEKEIQEKKRRRFESDDEEGIKLGLGDFCFYGVLVTRAARIGWDLTILCIFAVILGLSLTLIILAITQRPLPALPFSLLLGIIFYIIGIYTFRPFYQTITDLKVAI